MPESPREDDFFSLLAEDLAPYPGRISGSLRDTLGILLAVLLAMTLRVPGISLAGALLFLMQRERPGLTLRVGVQILGGCAAAAAMSLLWVQLTDGSEVARFLGLVVGVFLSAFCMAGTTTPLFWTIFGFYGFVDLAAWDAHRSTDATVTYCLNNVASFALVLACSAAVEYAFGTRHPAEEFDRELSKRINALERFYRTLADGQSQSQEFRVSRHALLQFSHAGAVYLNELYDRQRDFGVQIPVGLRYRIGLLTRAIQKSVGLGFYHFRDQEGSGHQEAYRAITELCHAIAVRETYQNAHLVAPNEPLPLREIYLELQQYAGIAQPRSDVPPSTLPVRRGTRSLQFFQPGVFDDPEVAFYALKLALAATVCYLIYNAVAWPGILTCVVTVLFTGLSSTGAMKQKQLYRLSGAAVGGALGIATVSLLFPNMDSITALMLVLTPVALLSSWVTRSPRISYVGVQIGFAFFLTALPGFGPVTQLSPARDRIIGVALGIGVMWFIFDQLWPIRTSDALRKALLQIRSATAQLPGMQESAAARRRQPDFDHLRASVSLELAHVQQLDFAARFEIGRHRKRELAQSRRLLREIEASAATFYSKALQLPQKD